MPLYKPKVPVCLAIACSGVAIVFQLVAVAATGWMKRNDNYSVEFGLFRVCSEIGCQTIDIDDDWWKVCQGFSICALVTIFGNFVLGVRHFFIADAQRLIRPARAFSVVAAVCLAVEVTLFAARTVDDIKSSWSSFAYGYGFYLSAVAGVLSVVSAILN